MPNDPQRKRTAAGRALRFASSEVGVAAESERRGRRARVYRALGLVVATFVLGTVGFRLITQGSYDLLTCFYMTVITISTVGFNEVIPIHESEILMSFTIVLTLLGMGVLLYFLTSVTAMVVEGDLIYQVWRRRMKKSIDVLRGHVLVAGAGSNGIHVIRELWRTGTAFVVIENDGQRVENLLREFGEELPHLVGDAREDVVLQSAGIAHARGLVATLPDDRDNLFLCLSARTLNPELRIVAKAAQATSVDKFRRAGVDSVVLPALIGGRRLAHELLQPHVSSFLESLFDTSEDAMRMEELEVPAGSSLAGVSLEDADLRTTTNCMVLGLRATDGGAYVFDPSPALVLEPGAKMIAFGLAGDLATLREKLGG